MMERELTPLIGQWLDTPPQNRDIAAGARLLLRINRNQITYRNIMQNPAAKADLLEYQLKKIYNDRLQLDTSNQVRSMLAEVEQVNRTCGLDKPQDATRSEFQRGKRADHDELPDEIKSLWEQNADILRKMRDCHTHLRLINSDNSSCPDSDRFPWAKELLRLNKIYRDNFNKYDHYVRGTSPVAAELVTDPRAKSRTAARLINLQKGRYAKSKDPELGDKIREWYSQVINPSDKMVSELRELGILDC